MPPGMSMKVLGTQKVLKNLSKVPDRAIKATGGGIYLEASNVMTDSKKQAPVDLGTMKGSGYVTPPEITTNNITVEIGYGGPAKEYAVKQHEHTEYNHEVGKAKYLQDPMMAHKAGFAAKVAVFARRLFNMGGGFISGSHPKGPGEGGGD